MKGYLAGIYFCIAFARRFCPAAGWDREEERVRVTQALQAACLQWQETSLAQPFVADSMSLDFDWNDAVQMCFGASPGEFPATRYLPTVNAVVAAQMRQRKVELNPSSSSPAVPEELPAASVIESPRLATHPETPPAKGQGKETFEWRSMGDAAALLIRYLRDAGTAFLGEKPVQAVVAAPHEFSSHRRDALVAAVRQTGMDVAEVIEEPLAIATAHELHRYQGKKTALVIDLGQHAFRASLVAIDGSTMTVAKHAVDAQCGGEQLDKLLLDYCLAEFLRQRPKLISMNLATTASLDSQRLVLRHLCEAAKRTLSFSPQTIVDLEQFADNSDLRVHVTRRKFEELADRIFTQMQEHITTLIKAARLDPGDLFKVVLAGGGAYIPKIRALLTDTVQGQELCWDNVCKPEEAVAQGAAQRAAIHAGIMMEVGQEPQITDYAPLSLGIEIEGGVMMTVIQRGTAIPCNRQISFSIATDAQSGVLIQVFEGERHLTRDNMLLDRFLLDGIGPSLPGDNNIRVDFTIDLHNDLIVTVSDHFSGVTKGVNIPAAARRRGAVTTQMVLDDAVFE